MARQDKLVNVGLGSFSLFDEVYGNKKKLGQTRDPTTAPSQVYDHCHHQYYNNNNDNQQQYVYWGPQVITVREPVINSNQAARFYGGVSIADHGMRNPIRGV
ncbi:hypothetical protein OWV82_005681 [Melia azedarach]|uniref:Uncharacterized protein n=1 Tax=Melia azedarach TaxID=155640 RepID=A0ACC1YFD6_MELAZ|nr:hypothetical protein OWV82_005681 [Melia azedarach]